MPTTQETFDTVVTHLRTQGSRCSSDSGDCMYRLDGRKCAAGCLIPDDRYSPDMEGTTVLYSDVGDLLAELGHDMALVDELQTLHDRTDPAEWEEGFGRIAGRFGLVYRPPHYTERLFTQRWQTTFDRVVSHLRKQGCKAHIHGSCKYRVGDMSCAAGCLIPDEKYRPDFENTVIIESSGSINSVGEVLREEGHDLTLVRVLQLVHDLHEPCGWEAKFAHIAAAFDLDYISPAAMSTAG